MATWLDREIFRTGLSWQRW